MNTCNTTSLVHKTVQENVINITFSPYLYQNISILETHIFHTKIARKVHAFVCYKAYGLFFSYYV